MQAQTIHQHGYTPTHSLNHLFDFYRPVRLLLLLLLRNSLLSVLQPRGVKVVGSASTNENQYDGAVNGEHVTRVEVRKTV